MAVIQLCDQMEAPQAETQNNLDEEIESTIKEHGGLITRDKAKELVLRKQQGAELAKKKLTAAAAITYMLKDGEIVDIEDNVYRIFNKVRFTRSDGTGVSRTLVFGATGNSVRCVFWEKSAEFPDAMLIQHNDKALATNMRVHRNGDEVELFSTPTTYFSKLAPCKPTLTDLTQLKGGEKNLDAVGRIVSVGNPRFFRGLNGSETGVSDCTISDGKKEVKVTLWGSSSSYVSDMHPGDYIKIEFASAKMVDNGLGELVLELSANDNSRILISKRAF